MTTPLYISEADVVALLDMRGAIAALAEMFRAQADGKAKNAPRQRAHYWGGRLNMMSAGAASGRFACKVYAGTRAPTVFHVMLYDVERGLLGIIEADNLGRLRTGAATGVAVDHMAPKSAARLGIIGAGRQARTQVRAIAAVRSLREAKVYSRDAARAGAFCAEMSKELAIDLRPAASAEACVAGADIIVTATTSGTPVVRDAWLGRNVHISAMGANSAARAELEVETYARAGVLATDDVEQARIEASELIALVARGERSWSDVRDLASLVARPAPTAPIGGISIFKSLGCAIEDLAAASMIYDRAIEAGFDRRVGR